MDGLIAYILAKQYADDVGEAVKQQGFKVQVEQDRSILQTTGQEKIYYFLPKENAKPGDGYDEYIWTDASGWEQTGGTDVDLSTYATKEYLSQQIEAAQEIYVGEETPTGEEVVWIDTASQPTPPEPPVPTETVFGVAWDYSLSSPQLARLTSQTDPLGVVTTVPSQEPTACIGNDGNGQSEFDNFMPWKGMRRVNYVNGQVVDFVSYNNGETFVYIPEFWSKIVSDTANGRMYFYIADSEVTGFTKHPGSGKYMSRYECNSNFLSAPGTKPKVSTNLGGFRTGITAIDNKHYQYDIHTYAALELLYIIEFAHLNTQSKIGAGITSGSAALTIGKTDILTYHTGKVDGTADSKSAVQYRWIENLWGNVWNWVDGILIQDGLVYICNDRANYASSITNDYESTGLYAPTNSDWHKTDQDYNNCYLIPLTTGSSDSTYTCDYYHYNSGLRGLGVGSNYGYGSFAGLFCWAGHYAPGAAYAAIGGRAVLILN